MLRWLGVLVVLSLLTGLLAFGVIPTLAVGLTHMLFLVFSMLLLFSLIVALLLS